MNTALQTLLSKYRNASKTEREKGAYFERLAQDFLRNDPLYAPQFDEVLTYSDWAAQQGKDKRDTGIDLVAKIAGQDGYCAVQCKFYDEDHKISKKEIDSFFTASGKAPFTRRLIIDTTRAEWSEHAEEALRGQNIDVNRIGLRDLEQSPIDWTVYAREQKVVLKPKKQLMDHQKKAVQGVKEGLAQADRGKLIMACGTGKTFTSLKIAENQAGKGKRVLYLVPSLALMSQTVREWSNDSDIPLHSFAVCSDAQVGVRRAQDDLSDLNVHDLAFPATTDPRKLAEKMSGDLVEDVFEKCMTVVFSTYQSIQVISDAQTKYGMADFDLIICDEAHRTTGAKLADEDDSNFVKVHYQDYIKAKKRIYMTATPRIYGDNVKTKAKEVDAVLCSMDDTALFGDVLYEITFSEAVQQRLLTDYKVIVLAVDEAVVSASVQKRLAEADELKLDDVTRIIGCYRALTKLDLREDLRADQQPMRRAVAFCNTIANSKLITEEFAAVVSEYLEEQDIDADSALKCAIQHVDGTYNAKERQVLIDWLNNVEDANTCHILTNARCLSEGVDVPALDAIMFMHPRKSQIDVVQSVGRVMRRAEGKNLGYVILPVGVPAGVAPEDALDNNEKYKVVWQILNALRAHDDRFESDINRINLGEKSSKIEIVAVSHTLPERKDNKKKGAGIGTGAAVDTGDEGGEIRDPKPASPVQSSFVFDEFSKAILARIVKKCGTREYWEDWANDIADIAQKHISRIKGMLSKNTSKERAAFDAFLEEIRDDLNGSISEDDAIEMLAQHLITKPVFEALFEGYSFAQNNPVSQAMQHVLDVLQEQNLEKEAESLQKFYDSVRRRAVDIKTTEARQQIIVQLYDKFFRNAFPRLTEKLGIVYTPVEVVDFIIHSVNDVLKAEFGQTLGSKGVHILDPFTGTGTFITRLLQSGLIASEELPYKYENEIHANEIVLLAYYIAAINIEQVYHGITGRDYTPFNGICLTDTFQLYEKDDLVSKLLVDNSGRRKRQKALDIRVIIGNPPYSVGQKSANDANANIDYPHLDAKIGQTYAAHSSATNKNAIYDSYIRAIRWGSDRIGQSGVMAYVSNAGWIDGNAMDGLRKCLVEEYSSLYVFHLRGNARTSGELRRKEKDNVFGQGTRTPIAITLFVKNPNAKENGKIHFYDIGDYLSQKEKLAIIRDFKSIEGIKAKKGWQEIIPDQFNDWIGQRDESFDTFIDIGDKKDKNSVIVFDNFSRGIETGRDSWCYNSSKQAVSKNIRSMIEFYNSEIDRLNKSSKKIDKNLANTDPVRISWTSSLFSKFEKANRATFYSDRIITGIYRPYQKQHLYYDGMLNHRVGQMPHIFPNDKVDNKLISVSGIGAKEFSALMVNSLPCLDMIEKGQCFPLKLYEKGDDTGDGLFAGAAVDGAYRVRDGISDEGLAHFRAAYPGEKITKEDVFYYIYGLLHSEDYRTRYADNLSKQLPRIPCVKKPADFWAFVDAGRKLGDLHVNYESVEPYPVSYKEGALFMGELKPADYRVEKMKFGKRGKDVDKSVVIYNNKITMTGVPLAAYDYVVNGKPALEWVMERQCVKTDKDSGIVNDANLYAIETVGDPVYPLKLFQRVITVSLETMKIVNALPKLDIQQPVQQAAE